jgi:hypothetical protein
MLYPLSSLPHPHPCVNELIFELMPYDKVFEEMAYAFDHTDEKDEHIG